MSANQWSTITNQKKVTPLLTHESLPYGLKVLAEGTDAILDIVAVHGLNGHREKSWTVNDVNWLRNFLPSDIPNARILTWGYDANTHICSSSQALVHSDAARQEALEEHRSIKLSTYGIFFMGTPHQGSSSGVHLGVLVRNVVSIFGTANDKITKYLERDSEWIQQQLGQYGPLSKDFVTKFAYETYPTQIAMGKTIMVVPYASAIIPGVADAEPLAMPADHVNMIKFTSRENCGYEKVSGHLKLLAEKAAGAIDARWAGQDKMKKDTRNDTAILASSRVDENFDVSFSLTGVPEIENFVGRDKELIEIKGVFQGDGSHRKTVILQGLGGIGKTQLAVAFAKQQKDNLSALFWLNGQNEDTLKQSYIKMAKRLYNNHPLSMLLSKAAESKEPDQAVEAVKRWLSAKGNIRWMLVFDNIDNPISPGVKDPQAYDIRSYFPETDQGFILITTRSSQLKIGKVIRVKKLHNIQESIAILSHMSERQISDQDPDAVELAKTLDGLPLALATAGAYLSQVTTSLTDYLVHYRNSWLKLQKTSPELCPYEDRALYSTWNISYQHICSQNKSAGKLLQLWGYFDNQDLWYALLAPESKSHSREWFSNMISDELSFNQAIRLLCNHALIESHGDSDGYSMHSCVHAWIMYALNSIKDISMAELAFICVGSAVPERTVFEYWTLQRRLLPHANRCIGSVYDNSLFDSKNNKAVLSATFRLGILCHDQDKKKAEEMYLRALKGYEKTWGAEHTSTFDIVNNLGLLYSRQDKMKEAEEMYLRALKGYVKTWGAEHTSTFDIVNNLGLLYSRQGKMKEAEEMYLQALKGYEKAWGTEHMSTLTTVNNLGALYSDQGKIKEAEDMYLRALKGYEKAWGKQHTSTLETLNNLGVLYFHQDKMKEAEEIYLRALKGNEKAWGAEHTSTLDIVSNLGLLYSDQGKMKEAEEMYLRALRGYEKAWGAEHTSMFDTVNNLGLLYSDQGMMKEAEEIYLWALRGKEKAWGTEHRSTLTTVNNLGLLYSRQGKMKEAEEMYLRALKGYEKAWGAEHTSTLTTVNNLGALYSDQGKMKEAEEMYLRALRGKEKAWGAEHTSTLATVNNLGALYSDQGKMKEAEEMYLRALKGYEKAWGKEHTSTLETVNNLGLLYFRQGMMKEAEEMYLRALRGYEKAWGTEHTSTLTTVNNLGGLYCRQGKMREAEEMYLCALRGYEKIRGAEHKDPLDTRFNLASLYAETRQLQAAIEQLETVVQGYTNVLGLDHRETVEATELLNRYQNKVPNGTNSWSQTLYR
ncbi:hypothetical protein MMC29_004505 [Sticta canariensis]|nr:hypothetical protein [Sticta canariensis]